MRISKGSKAYVGCQEYAHLIMRDTVIAIDPSSGSSSSMPGYAVYQAGTLVESGTLNIRVGKDLHHRLQQLVLLVRGLYKLWNPVVVVYEEIPPQRHGGGNAAAHASLLKAVGAILSVPGPTGWVGLLPRVWKSFVSNTYSKSDENDAIEIGKVMCSLAQEYLDEEEVKKTKKKIRTKSNKPQAEAKTEKSE